MNNTVLIESKLRQKLRLTCTILCVFCLCAIAVLVCIVMIGNKNLNGQVTEIEGVLDKVYEKESNVISMKDEKEYNVVWASNLDVDLNEYKDKTVTLVVTQEAFAGANPWVLGLIVDNETIVDYNETLIYKTESNNELKTVIISVTVILCVITCGVFIWRFNVKPHTERPLLTEFAEFLSQRQPTCPERKSLIVYLCVYIGLMFALMLTGVILSPTAETINDLPSAAVIVLWVLVGVAIIGAAGVVILLVWLNRREIEFYNDNLPFDFSDISHAPLRKKVKEELQQELRKERDLHPDTYADGGNGYDITFDEKGVLLSEPYDYDASAYLPDADDVFAITGDKSPLGQVVIKLSYEELNLEAVPHFRKGSRPMMIIVKSRLQKNSRFPEELVNDIHIPLDANFQKTLNKFNVKVENLDYLLSNKKQLMLENCLILFKNRGKIKK